MSPGSFHGVMELGGASFQITFLPTVHDRTGQGQQLGSNDAPVRLPGGLTLYIPASLISRPHYTALSLHYLYSPPVMSIITCIPPHLHLPVSRSERCTPLHPQLPRPGL